MDKIKRCECCGQLIPPDAPFSNAPVKQRIYDFLAASPMGRTTPDIINHVYADDPDGGPTTYTTVSVHIAQMNKSLRHRHAVIKSTRGPGARYRLEVNPARKLNKKLAAEIRALYPKYSHRKLGKMFGVSYNTVANVVRGKSWQ